MKAGKMSLEADTAELIKPYQNSEVGNGKGKNSILITVLPIVSMIVAILPGIINKADGLEIAKIAILTMILTTAATFYIRFNVDTVLGKKLAKTVITTAYLGSIFLLFLIPKPYMYCFWMIGGILIAMVIDNKLGLLFHFNLSFLMGITNPEIVIQLLIMGVIMTLLAGALRSKSTVVYAIIIILSTNVTLSFVINNFIFNVEENYNYINSLFSILAVLVTAFLLCLFYDHICNKITNTGIEEGTSTTNSKKLFSDITLNTLDMAQAELTIQQISSNHSASNELAVSPNTGTENSDIVIDQVETTDTSDLSTITRIIGTSASYDVLCSLDNELLMKLKKHSEGLYAHALYIGDLSSRAAMELGADILLAKAGGLYHEIGKINGKNYIEEGLLIAEDYAFPKELKSILKEHNIKYDKPSSIEAAIVMLSDSVVSTIEYIEKSDEHKFTTNKIIDNIFQMRMEKGTFDLANLSLKEFKTLKEFYQKEFNR